VCSSRAAWPGGAGSVPARRRRVSLAGAGAGPLDPALLASGHSDREVGKVQIGIGFGDVQVQMAHSYPGGFGVELAIAERELGRGRPGADLIQSLHDSGGLGGFQ